MSDRKISNVGLQDQMRKEAATRFTDMDRQNMTMHRQDFKQMLQVQEIFWGVKILCL
jgi:hypothetical protein